MSVRVDLSMRSTHDSAAILQKEGPIIKYGHRFGRIRRMEQRWMKLTNMELSYAQSSKKSPIVQIPITDIALVYTKDSLPKNIDNFVTNLLDLHKIKGSSNDSRVEFSKTDITNEDFVICTLAKLGHKGKQYAFKALTVRLRDEWVDAIGSQVTASRSRPKIEQYQNETCFHRIRNKLRLILFADDFQSLIGVMVIHINI